MKTTVTVLLLCCSVPALAAASHSADVLDRWVGGKWTSDAHFCETEFSKASTGSSVTTCAWSPDHIFVVCDQDVTDNGAALRFLSV